MSLKPLVLWEPSQNGLLAEWPQRHRPIAVRPAKPNAWPWGSQISKSPSILIEPLLFTVILVAAIYSPEEFSPLSLREVCPASHRTRSRALQSAWEETDRGARALLARGRSDRGRETRGTAD